MSNNDFDFDIDSILSEYTGAQDEPPKERNQAEESSPEVPARRATIRSGYTASSAKPETALNREVPPAEQQPAEEAPAEEPKKPKKKLPEEKKKKQEEPQADESEEEDSGKGRKILNILLGVCLGICLIWGLFHIDPFRTTTTNVSVIAPLVTATPAPQTAEETTQGESVQTETSSTVDDPDSSAAPEVTKTVYKLEEGQPAPAPNPSCYGQVSTTDAAKINDVIAQAREYGLLGEDEEVYFRSDLPFNTGSYYQDIMYYLDESILVICWKEIEDGFTLTMCEVKIGDGSQFRMEVFGDIYNENDNSYLSQMILANNGVIAMNSDKCKARGDGVLVCDRVLYKYNENTYAGALKRYNCLDNCYVTGDGDFLFTKRLEEMTTEQMQQYIIDNNIIFSMSFGPLLIENGEMVYGYNPGDDNYIEYAFGETEKPYSRCGMGQIGQRHYLYTSLNHSDEQAARWTMREFAQHMYDRGILENFYALDGGQTAELIIGDTIYNHVDFGAERLTSNCIYFATAIPNGEG